MTNTNDDLVLDPDGIPILTDLVHEDEARPPAEQPQESRIDKVSADDLAQLLLNSDTFRRQLDELAGELTRTVREQIELAMKPVIEEAITLALDDSSAASNHAIRNKLESILPDLLARTLQD